MNLPVLDPGSPAFKEELKDFGRIVGNVLRKMDVNLLLDKSATFVWNLPSYGGAVVSVPGMEHGFRCSGGMVVILAKVGLRGDNSASTLTAYLDIDGAQADFGTDLYVGTVPLFYVGRLAAGDHKVNLRGGGSLDNNGFELAKLVVLELLVGEGG